MFKFISPSYTWPCSCLLINPLNNHTFSCQLGTSFFLVFLGPTFFTFLGDGGVLFVRLWDHAEHMNPSGPSYNGVIYRWKKISLQIRLLKYHGFGKSTVTVIWMSSSLAKVPIRFSPLPLGRFRQVSKAQAQWSAQGCTEPIRLRDTKHLWSVSVMASPR